MIEIWYWPIFCFPSTCACSSLVMIKFSEWAFYILHSLSWFKSLIWHFKPFTWSHSIFDVILLRSFDWFQFWLINRCVNLIELFKLKVKVCQLHLNLFDVIFDEIGFICDICQNFLWILVTVFSIITKFIDLSSVLV